MIQVYVSLFWFCFLNFIPIDRAEISHMNRQQIHPGNRASPVTSRKKYPFLFNGRRTVRSLTWRIPALSIRRREVNEPSRSLNSAMLPRTNASCSGVSFLFLPLKHLLFPGALSFAVIMRWTLAVETLQHSAIAVNVRFVVAFRTRIEAFVSYILLLDAMLFMGSRAPI